MSDHIKPESEQTPWTAGQLVKFYANLAKEGKIKVGGYAFYRGQNIALGKVKI